MEMVIAGAAETAAKLIEGREQRKQEKKLNSENNKHEEKMLKKEIKAQKNISNMEINKDLEISNNDAEIEHDRLAAERDIALINAKKEIELAKLKQEEPDRKEIRKSNAFSGGTEEVKSPNKSTELKTSNAFGGKSKPHKRAMTKKKHVETDSYI